MNLQHRQCLSRNDIDARAQEVLLHFDPRALFRPRSPIYEVVVGLKDKFGIDFGFDEDLGFSSRGKKILGRFEFESRRILVDRVLPADSPRFRWTLCHEIGHLVLHRKLNPKLIFRVKSAVVDTATELRFARKPQRSELDWIEWQANQFAAALLLPRVIVGTTLGAVQHEFGIPRLGRIYLDDQTCNVRDYAAVLHEVSIRLNVSRTVLRIRLLNLGILTDADRERL